MEPGVPGASLAPALAPAGRASASEPASATTLRMLSIVLTVIIANEEHLLPSVLSLIRLSHHMDGCSFFEIKSTV